MDNARDILARTIKDLFDLLTRLNFKDMEILFSKMEIIRKNQIVWNHYVLNIKNILMMLKYISDVKLKYAEPNLKNIYDELKNQ